MPFRGSYSQCLLRSTSQTAQHSARWLAAGWLSRPCVPSGATIQNQHRAINTKKGPHAAVKPLCKQPAVSLLKDRAEGRRQIGRRRCIFDLRTRRSRRGRPVLATEVLKRGDQVGGNRARAAAFDVPPLYHVHRVSVFKQRYKRR